MAESTPPTPLEERFFTANSGEPPTPEQRIAVAQIRDAVVALANNIVALVPEGRNKSLALTELETVQMRANRGIFATGDSR